MEKREAKIAYYHLNELLSKVRTFNNQELADFCELISELKDPNTEQWLAVIVSEVLENIKLNSGKIRVKVKDISSKDYLNWQVEAGTTSKEFLENHLGWSIEDFQLSKDRVPVDGGYLLQKNDYLEVVRVRS